MAAWHAYFADQATCLLNIRFYHSLPRFEFTVESETPDVREISRLLKEHPHLRGKVAQWLYSEIPPDVVLKKLKAEIDHRPTET